MRKSTVFRTALLIVAVMALGSCTWFLSVFNHMDVDGERYELSQMTTVYYGQYTDSSGNTVYEHGVLFMSDGLSVNASSGIISGTGDYLILGFGQSSSSFEGGDFNYSTTGAADTLLGGIAVVGFSSSAGTYDKVAFVDGGNTSLRVRLTGYATQFDLWGEDGDSGGSVDISGAYRGDADQELDFSTSSSSAQSFAPPVGSMY